MGLNSGFKGLIHLV